MFIELHDYDTGLPILIKPSWVVYIQAIKEEWLSTNTNKCVPWAYSKETHFITVVSVMASKFKVKESPDDVIRLLKEFKSNESSTTH